MGVVGIILTIVKIIAMIPSIISVGMEIIKLLPKFKGADFWEIVGLIAEILKLILGLAPKDKARASELMTELRDHLKLERGVMDKTMGLRLLREKVQRECTGVACKSDLVKE